MLERKYKKLFFLALGLIFLVMAVAYYLAVYEDTTEKTKLGKEILVAIDQGRGGEVFTGLWCGSRGVLNKGGNINANIGVEFIDFVTKKRIQISSNFKDAAIGCSPDGRWVLYFDSKTIRYDPSDEYIKGDFADWGGDVVDVYRYEISTGKRERVSTVRYEGAYEAISPDGKKILLGSRHSFSKMVAAPQWKGFWFSNEWVVAGAKWFSDSSGVVLRYHVPNKICVEFFGKNGWAKCFVLRPEIKGNISNLTIDRENRIYFTVFEGSDREYIMRGADYIYRCNIKDKEFFCERIDERDRMIYGDIDFLPDGDMVFSDKDKNCIRRFSLGQKKAKCIINNAYLTGVSRDGKWLVYERNRMIIKPDGEFSYWQYDLYVRELNND